MSSLSQSDSEMSNILNKERERHNSTIDLIASENYPSQAVLEAESSIFIGKYSSVPIMPTSSHTAGLRLIWQPITHFLNTVIPFWR
jgi:glycine/serine hydroxymethyltransferase